MSEVPAIQVEQVVRKVRSGFFLKPIEILHGISFDVPARSVFGFLGPNGAGKTTLIQLMVGLVRPQSGRVKIFGAEAQSTLARSRLGYLPERPYFYDFLTGRSLLQYFARLSGMDGNKANARIEEVLEQVRMPHAADLELRKYSKGMLQRIGIAQAILHDPDLIILDEPMSGLDPIGRKEVRELIRELHHAGKTILFSSHVIPDVEMLCDQVAIIRSGALVRSGSIDELIPAQNSHEVEVHLSGLLPDAPALSSGVRSISVLPEGLRVLLAPEGLNAKLGEWIQAGAQVHSVIPGRPSLEEYFK